MTNVLVIDDEVEVTTFFRYLLEDKQCKVMTANSGREAEELLRSHPSPFHLALIDLKLPDANGLDLLTKTKTSHPECEVLMMTGYGTVKSAVSALQAGAKDYLEKPFDDLDSLERAIEAALARSGGGKELPHPTAAEYGIICGPTSPLRNVLAVAGKLAPKPINIVIEGETGTGKELMARFIHGTSQRASHPFVGINCAAVPESLLESELFGHEKGAFSGAIKSRKGYFELANNGTLFMDEIGEAPLSVQVKLLRVLETGEYMRVGSEEIRKSNTRIISATNRDLEAEVQNKRFRADLLYRLEGVKLSIPPLRERPGDIPLIAQHYLDRKYGGACGLEPDAIEILQAYDWPGNVRQLLNVLNQTHAIHECKRIKAGHLPRFLLDEAARQSRSRASERQLDDFLEREAGRVVEQLVAGLEGAGRVDLKKVMSRIRRMETEVGRKIIENGLAGPHADRQSLSRQLNITVRTLRYILNEK